MEETLSVGGWRDDVDIHSNLEVSNMSHSIGEKPGKGTYRDDYGHTITLDSSDDALPPCGICGAGQNTNWTSV